MLEGYIAGKFANKMFEAITISGLLRDFFIWCCLLFFLYGADFMRNNEKLKQ